MIKAAAFFAFMGIFGACNQPQNNTQAPGNGSEAAQIAGDSSDSNIPKPDPAFEGTIAGGFGKGTRLRFHP